MDLTDADLGKTLECPVCLDVFDEPKLLICGHTVCQKCVNKVVTTRRNGANARQGRDRNSIKCPECNRETEIPPDGLATNYRLVDLVCRAQKALVDSYACNGCGEQALVAKMYTCETCQETLNTKPEDLAASQQEATDLEQKFVQASTFASEAGKVFESALRDCRERLEDLFPAEQDQEPVEKEGSGASRNNFDLIEFDDDQEAIELNGHRVDVRARSSKRNSDRRGLAAQFP
ncbi:e3 ubiquitin-protein ligase TRIM32 [Aphelenchoides avenae]|nr:e3 ubiquitin-protein ligase TRIM32 [Aphelenchus avenae]